MRDWGVTEVDVGGTTQGVSFGTGRNTILPLLYCWALTLLLHRQLIESTP